MRASSYLKEHEKLILFAEGDPDFSLAENGFAKALQVLEFVKDRI